MNKARPEQNFRIIAKTFSGLEEVLAKELEELGAKEITLINRGVEFLGNKKLLYKTNYCCRTALRVLKPIKVFSVKSADELYDKVIEIDWTDIFESNKTFAVDAVLGESVFDNSLFVARKVKDAIADRFRQEQGKRPDVDTAHPDIRINIHIHNDQATISIDSSGESLHQRGYRKQTGPAPINEVLAAGIIQLSGWNGKSNFADTMCGSGTIAIEAAMQAMNIPAGYYRENFSFMQWKDFDKTLWDEVKKNADAKIKESDYEIIASDISSRAIDIAKINLLNAKLHKDIRIVHKPFEEFNPPESPGYLIINPPYGERMHEDDFKAFYRMIGDVLKQKYAGYKAWIITSNLEAAKFVGLRPFRKIKLFNGPIECRLLGFELYEGSKKTKNQ